MVSGLSSPSFTEAALPASWDQRTWSDSLAPKLRRRILATAAFHGKHGHARVVGQFGGRHPTFAHSRGTSDAPPEGVGDLTKDDQSSPYPPRIPASWSGKAVAPAPKTAAQGRAKNREMGCRPLELTQHRPLGRRRDPDRRHPPGLAHPCPEAPQALAAMPLPDASAFSTSGRRSAGHHRRT